ncbi:hypothetical protein C0J52_04476 [Blattella germanica]|nr:hypothetical protein C0J52_04476 [Blattella germanica]
MYDLKHEERRLFANLAYISNVYLYIRKKENVNTLAVHVEGNQQSFSTMKQACTSVTSRHILKSDNKDDRLEGNHERESSEALIKRNWTYITWLSVFRNQVSTLRNVLPLTSPRLEIRRMHYSYVGYKIAYKAHWGNRFNSPSSSSPVRHHFSYTMRTRQRDKWIETNLIDETNLEKQTFYQKSVLGVTEVEERRSAKKLTDSGVGKSAPSFVCRLRRNPGVRKIQLEKKKNKFLIEDFIEEIFSSSSELILELRAKFRMETCFFREESSSLRLSGDWRPSSPNALFATDGIRKPETTFRKPAEDNENMRQQDSSIKGLHKTDLVCTALYTDSEDNGNSEVVIFARSLLQSFLQDV